jgi:putative colanic acid biosynthesis UDP-glucose lipid carrier transferase
MKKHLVKGGITGWAQVNGFRGDTDLNARIQYDLFYIENWSFWFDIKIMMMTIFMPLRCKNKFKETNET